MQKKIDSTTSSTTTQNQIFDLPAIPDFFVQNLGKFNWFEKAMLMMLKVKNIDFMLYELCSVFYAIRQSQTNNKMIHILDSGECIHILDQFLRRLGALGDDDVTTTIITRIALVSAAVGLKSASDLAVWNQDLRESFNNCFSRGYVMVSEWLINELEREHLETLDFVVGFGRKSNMNERLQNIMNYVDPYDMHIIESELATLQINGDELTIGCAVQEAMFKVSDAHFNFFKPGCTQSKNNDPNSRALINPWQS